MNKYLKLCLALSAAVVAPLVAAQEEAPSVSVSELKGNLYLLQGRGGNVVASVGEDGVLMIDDDYAEYAPAYHDALRELSADSSVPTFVINTHWHFDHTGGNNYWGEQGALIVAHTNVRERMSTRQEMKAFNRVIEPSPKAALPVVTYGDSLALHFNGDDVEVQHFPTGHTDGDSVVFFAAENVVHMGDHYFKDRFPFVDLGSGGNVLGFAANIEAVLAKVDDQTVIVPGHGDLADRKDLERYLDMLTRTIDAVQSGIEGGMTVEQITEKGLGDEWESWGSGFIKEDAWIGFIASSL
ncbi:MAG: MBL fold metallo-hydrolase [Halieaceae bacterium]|nr:MBL fold metallo-hydrolase [Halieaceae bacterium]